MGFVLITAANLCTFQFCPKSLLVDHAANESVWAVGNLRVGFCLQAAPAVEACMCVVCNRCLALCLQDQTEHAEDASQEAATIPDGEMSLASLEGNPLSTADDNEVQQGHLQTAIATVSNSHQAGHQANGHPESYPDAQQSSNDNEDSTEDDESIHAESANQVSKGINSVHQHIMLSKH